MTVICISALCCSVISVITLQGSTKKILNTVLGAFILCVMLVAVKNTVDGFKINIDTMPPKEDLSFVANEAYNQAVIKETKINLENKLKAHLSNNKINILDLDVELNSYDDGGIYISSINIYISKNIKHKSQEIINLTEKKFEIKPQLIVR